MSNTAMRFTVGKDFMVTTHSSSPCAACELPFREGERVYMLSHLATPWKAEDDETNEWGGYAWHFDCDEGSLAADA